MKQTKLFALPLLIVFLTGCAAILPGQDRVLVNAQRSINATHQTVYGLYRIEAENYAFFKAKAPDQAVAVRRQVNTLRANYPKVEKAAWNATEKYRTERTDANKNGLDIALAVLSQIANDAQSFTNQINSSIK